MNQMLEKKYEKLFDKYVPNSGKCESVGGEIIRAFAKLNYRWYNDGDKFYENYGVETCGSSALFLMENGFKKHLENMLYINDEDYENKLQELLSLIINHLEQHSELFELKNYNDSVVEYFHKAWKLWYIPEEEEDYDDED